MKNIKFLKITFLTILVMLCLSFFQIVLGPLTKNIISFYDKNDNSNLIYKTIYDNKVIREMLYKYRLLLK